jgi:thiamine-monophosphate kinase
VPPDDRTVGDLGEHELIQRITGRLRMPAWVLVGPGDDAAVIVPERGAVEVLTTDALVEGVHFERGFVPPAAIGHRALAVNLSDLAAMGARPRAALLSLILPASLPVADLDGLMDGLLTLAGAHRLTLIGGNIAHSPGPLIVDVTAIGTTRPRRVLTRQGARPGDEIYVTGTLADAAVGLRVLRDTVGRGELAVDPVKATSDGADGQAGTPPDAGAWSACVERYLRPVPRVRAGLVLAGNRAASSCMDLSDGLADAARQVAARSGVGMILDAAALPIGTAARAWLEARGLDAVRTALSGGDDYELLFTVRPAHRGRLRGVRRQLGEVPITRIGVVTKERDLLLREESGLTPLPSGYEHFR